MTEPEVSGSDPTTLQTRAELDGDEWVINGHKWFTSGAVGADFAIAMVVTDPDAAPYARASMILVPIDNPGFDLVRPVPVMGHDKGPGHCEIRYEDCRVPEANLLGERGAGFVIAQDRLGPGRIHHCMRAIGTAERAIEMMCDRANTRESFGGPLADKQFIQDFIAKLADGGRPGPAAHPLRRLADGHRGQAPRPPGDLDDQGGRRQRGHGRPRPRDPGPRRARDVGRHPAGRRCGASSRMLRVADGPDEVHKMVIARRELNRAAKRSEGGGGEDGGSPAKDAAPSTDGKAAEPAKASS